MTTTLVIAPTVERSRIICRELTDTRAIPVSPLSIIASSAARGLVVDTVLVDANIWPLANDVMDELGPIMHATAAPILLWPGLKPAA